MTLCRGQRSHDVYYYANPDRITGDMPPVPFLTMHQGQIIQRLLAKECLRQAFQSAQVHWWDSPTKTDTHGEFGFAKQDPTKKGRKCWDDVRAQISKWLDDANQSTEKQKREIIDALIGDSPQEEEKNALFNYLSNELVQQLDHAVANPEITGDGVAERLAEAGVLPMYGMPSRTRNLYHAVTPQDVKTIDRDLEVAITEFAPGAQKTKDGAVHTAIGFTSPIIKTARSKYWPESYENPLPYRTRMLRCLNCGYANMNAYNIDECPICGVQQGDSQLKNYDIAVPAAFRTDLSRGRNEKEGEVYFGRLTSTAESSDPSANFTIKAQANCDIGYTERNRVWRINDNNGSLFQGKKITTKQPKREHWRRGPILHNQWIENNYIDEVSEGSTDVACEEIAIAAGKTTNVLRFKPLVVPPGINLDPNFSKGTVKAAIYSAAFLLRSTVAELIDVDPEAIEICNFERLSVNNLQAAGVITLSDALPNGAGFVRHIAENWVNILSDIIEPKNETFFPAKIVSDAHTDCDSACYDCLKSYSNMQYHGILDWRLGLSYLNILADAEYACGLGDDFTRPELSGWRELAAKQGQTFASHFGYELRSFKPLTWIVTEQRPIIVVHPLWDVNSPYDLLARVIAETEAETGGKPLFVDTFNLLRRPSWCHIQISRGLVE